MTKTKKITNPFPGLRPFESDEYRLFFGREGQSDALISRLQRSRFLAVVGTSGSGKSSLVRAGLLPALRGGMMAGAGSGWRIAIMRPGSDPIGNLALALAKEEVLLKAGGGLPQVEVEAIIDASLRRGALGLVEVARQARLAENEKLLVVVDQFEELFRFRAARGSSSTRDDASAFVKLLIEASQQRELSIYVVPTMRSDFLGDCAQFQGLPEAINDGQYLIPRMTRDERRFAITGPVGVTRGKITEPLVSRLMNDVGDNPDQLPILQHALMRTWNYWAAHRLNGEAIGLEHYEAIGTMSDALSLHADEAYEQLPEPLRPVCEILFKTLTERGADNREIRRPTRLKDICEIAGASAADVIAVIDVFRDVGCSFLMPPAGVELKPETVIDISHESLIRNWDRLQEWVNEEAQSARIYRRLAEAAVLHRQGREGLLQDPGLQIALDWRDKSKPNAAWAAHYSPEFDESLAYLEESRAARDAALAERERQRQEQIERDRRDLQQAQLYAEQQRRAAQRMRRFTFALVLISLLALAAAGGAAYAFAKAKKSEELALTEKTNAVAARDAAKRSEEIALHEQRNAVVASEAAQESEKSARKEQDKATKLAKELAASTDNLQRNLTALQVAEADRQRQTDIAKERAAAAEIAQYRAEGLDAARSRNFAIANDAFNNLARKLEAALHPAGKILSQKEVNDLNEALGWALANLGATQRPMRDLTGAKGSYERARTTLETVWPTPTHREHTPGPILFETYHGLGNTYRDIALEGHVERNGARETVDKMLYFKQAQDVFRGALEFQKDRLNNKQEEGDEATKEIAAGHINLARLYRDMGMVKETEQNLTELVKVQELFGGTEERISSLRELSEFYSSQDRFDAAEAHYKRLIEAQENLGSLEEYARKGQEIANSYAELAEVYGEMDKLERSKIEKAKMDLDKSTASASTKVKQRAQIELRESRLGVKANDASAAAITIQRVSLKLRRLFGASRVSTGKADERDDLADAAGDVYSKLGKFDRALWFYEKAREIRETGTPEDRLALAKSYDNLTKLYRRFKKDPANVEEYNRRQARAEEYNQRLLNLYENQPWGAEYAGAVVQLAALYGEDPNKYTAAETNYRKALEIYERQNDWWNENLIHYRLSRLYLKQKKDKEHRQALRDRVNALTKYFNQLASPSGPQPKEPVLLVSEFLHAVGALATGNKDPDEAENAYARVLVAYDHITTNIKDMKVLDFYALTLEDYRRLLVKNKKPVDAANIAEKSKGVRAKLLEIDDQRRQEAALAQDAAAQ